VLKQMGDEVHRLVWGADADPVPVEARSVQESTRVINGLNEVVFGSFGLRGDVDNYYDPRNSFLAEVLQRKVGIPISLSVVWAAVATRVGLKAVLLAHMPMHVLVRVPCTDGDIFVDTFESGKVIGGREQVQNWARQRGLVQWSDDWIRPGEPLGIYQRMMRNLLSIYKEKATGPWSMLSALGIIQQSGILEGPQHPHHRLQMTWPVLGRLASTCEVYARECCEYFKEVAATGQDVRDAIVQMEAIYESAVRYPFGAAPRLRDGAAVLYKVGQVYKHKNYGYTAVICGWATKCEMSEDWIQQMGVDRLPKGRDQPFYNSLVDEGDRPSQATFVAEENIIVLSEPTKVQHQEIGKYFRGWDPQSGYIANEDTLFAYPEL